MSTEDKAAQKAAAVAELRAALRRVEDATGGDSNDTEIEELTNALDLALNRWPEIRSAEHHFDLEDGYCHTHNNFCTVEETS